MTQPRAATAVIHRAEGLAQSALGPRAEGSACSALGPRAEGSACSALGSRAVLTAPPLPPDRGGPGEIEAHFAALQLWPLLGTDEAGRGPLAGPVVAAAVVLRDEAARGDWPALAGLDDSKRLTPEARAVLEPAIHHAALAWHVEPAWEDEIAQRNILHASLAAMRRACVAVLQQLRDQGHPLPGVVVIDGNQLLPAWPDPQSGQGASVSDRAVPQCAVVKGDGRSRTIAAASVLAKVWRDRHMDALDTQYPGYGFAVHKGYPTPAHLEALGRLGPSPVHRAGFGPVRGGLGPERQLAPRGGLGPERQLAPRGGLGPERQETPRAQLGLFGDGGG